MLGEQIALRFPGPELWDNRLMLGTEVCPTCAFCHTRTCLVMCVQGEKC